MHRIAVIGLIIGVLLPTSLLAAAAPYGLDLGRYHALVISNQDYRQLDPLRTPHADADALANLLRRDYGFRIRQLKDANRAGTLDALDQLVEKLTPNDNLLIFYAGHGHLDAATGEGYWLPVTANPKRRSEWISNSDISDTLRATAARHVLVISDSCFSGTLSRNAAAGLRVGHDKRAYFEKLVSRVSRTALSSGGLEPVDDGGGGAHSVFARALLAALERNNEPLLEAESLYGQIKRPVALNSSATQKPQYSDVRSTGHDEGDFLFFKRNVRLAAPPVEPAVPTAPAAVPTPAVQTGVTTDAAYELAFWDSIKDSRNAADFQAYLQAYPVGQFVSLAQLRIKQYTKPKQRPVPVPVQPVIAPEPEPAKPQVVAKLAEPAPVKNNVSLANVVFVVRAVPDIDYAPNVADTDAYSKKVAGLFSKHYPNQSSVFVTDDAQSRSVIFEDSDHPISKGLCEKYKAKNIVTLEIDMSRDQQEDLRTPDTAYLGRFNCTTGKRQLKEYRVDFRVGEAFAYENDLLIRIADFDRTVKPLTW